MVSASLLFIDFSSAFNTIQPQHPQHLKQIDFKNILYLILICRVGSREARQSDWTFGPSWPAQTSRVTTGLLKTVQWFRSHICVSPSHWLMTSFTVLLLNLSSFSLLSCFGVFLSKTRTPWISGWSKSLVSSRPVQTPWTSDSYSSLSVF